MNNYYATFMQKQAFKNMFVKIEALDEGMARDAMFAHFGDKFMTVYDDKGFDGQEDKYGLKCLCVIKAIDHGSSIEYKLI